MFNIAQQIVGGTAAAALILSDHVNGTAWYQSMARSTDEHGSTDDFTDALVAAVAADRFATEGATEQLLSDAELDALTADIDYEPVDLDDTEHHEFVVPFADGLGFDWPDDTDDPEPFFWAGVDMSDSEVPF